MDLFIIASSKSWEHARMRLLLVEDDAALGTVIQRGLAEDGHAVDWERTVAGAMEAVRLNSSSWWCAILAYPMATALRFAAT
jgi:DNA-binding response OmpR family regulator